ncbi:hypothetical protein MC885_007627 [Smutsia gigantea]|nr:hypothetical protein MC885_007627 [Smutsia gigantea]
MDQHSVGEEGALPSKMHLPSFSDSQGLNCSNALNQDLGPSSRHLLHARLDGLDPDPSLLVPNVPSKVLKDNLDSIFLYSMKDSDSMRVLEEYADPESQASLQDLELGVLKVPREADEGGRATSSSSRKGRQQQSPLDCSLCGKVFSNASSLNKHYLSHSQERKHVCVICSKAFKRQDHLTGHMLTHQKTKPFACNELGCSKSYCDYRSLRRHCEVQHGLCILKEAPLEEEACGNSPHDHEVASQPAAGGRWSLVPPEARAPGSLLPNRDLLQCIMGSTVHQKISSPGLILARPSEDREGENTACPCPPSLGPYPSIPAASGALDTDVPKECHPPWKESAQMLTTMCSRAVECGGPDPADSERLLQLPSTLERWQEGRTLPACLPLFQGQTAPASSQPSNHIFQWLWNLPGCPKSKGNNVFVIHKPTSVYPQEGSEYGSRPSSTSLTGEPFPSSGTSLEGTLPLPRTLLKAPGEASGGPRYASEEGDFWASKNRKFDCDSCSWQHLGESGLQEALKPSRLPSDATPLFRQLFLKSQESLVAVASSQHTVPEGKQAVLKPLQGPWPQQPPPLAPTVHSSHAGPANPKPEGSAAHKRKTMPAFPREALHSSTRQEMKGGPEVAPASLGPPGNPDISSLAKQLRFTKGPLDLGDIFLTGGSRKTVLGGDNPTGAQFPGRQAQAENGLALGAMKCEKGPARSPGSGHRLFSGNPQAQRFSAFRKEVKMDTCCAASPSQVAMASFSSARPSVDPMQDSKSKLMVFNRIQLPHPVKEEYMTHGCNQQSGGPADWAEPTSIHVCKHCSQMFNTEKRLNSHMCFHKDQWLSPRGKQDQQMFGTEFYKPLKQVLRPEVEGQSPPGARRSSDIMSTAPLGTPVSVPVGPVSQPPESTAKGQDRDKEKTNSKENSHPRKRKRHSQPKALFMPPAPSAFGRPGPEGGHQSCLLSPVLLVDHLMKGLFHCSPYTLPPMLSPIREGSGLYFNTLSSMSTQAGPDKLISTKLDEGIPGPYQVDRSSGTCVVKDDTKISSDPQIRIGSQFQAEIPELQERSLAGTDEHGASLVWKPWGDVMSNPETQDRVAEFCNVACSSVMPGGGTNLELALHCLHEAQGNVQEALETLLLRGAQKPQTHPLADYHYTGSDIWTPMEKSLFEKAFCAHKNNFSLIHKMISTKTVAQCVEYYYLWKKRIRFNSGRAPGLKKRVKTKLDEADRTETKATCSPQKGPNHRPTCELKIKTKSYRREAVLNSNPNAGPKQTPEPLGTIKGQGAFPCRECERVFDKIKSRNAHMKRHRLQDRMEPTARTKWPVKPFEQKEEEEEKDEEIGADTGPLQ